MNVIERAVMLKEKYSSDAVLRAVEPLIKAFAINDKALRYHINVLISLKKLIPDQSLPVSLDIYRKVRDFRRESQDDAELKAWSGYMRDDIDSDGIFNSFWIEVLIALDPNDIETSGIAISNAQQTIDDLYQSKSVSEALNFAICRVIWCSVRGEAKAAHLWADVLTVVNKEFNKNLQNSWDLVDTNKVYQTAIKLIHMHGIENAHIEAWSKKRSYSKWYERQDGKFWSMAARLICGSMRHNQSENTLACVVNKADELKKAHGELSAYKALVEMFFEAHDGNKKASWFWLDVALYLKRLEPDSRLPVIEKFIDQAQSFQEHHSNVAVYDASMELTNCILSGNKESALEWICMLAMLNKRDDKERLMGNEKSVLRLWDLEHRYSESKFCVEDTIEQMFGYYDEVEHAKSRAIFKCLYCFDYSQYEFQWEVVPEFWLNVLVGLQEKMESSDLLYQVEKTGVKGSP